MTILFVDEEYDRGPILHQAGGVPVYPNDTPEKIAARVIKVEHRAYSEAVQIWLNKQTK